jgi:hypothetical protein
MDITGNSLVIKARFIDYLLDSLSIGDTCIGQEVMYGTNRRLADLVLIADNKLHAFEIKSRNDNLRRIHDQLLNYERIFDYIHVITTADHLAGLRTIQKKNFGLYLIDSEGRIAHKRKAPEQKSFSPQDAVDTIPALFLKKRYAFPSAWPADKIRAEALKMDTDTIKGDLYAYLKHTISPRYRNFMESRGRRVHFEDVLILSMRNYSVLW